MKNIKKVLLITAISVSLNASADIFDDIGDWVENNKAVTAIVGVGALTAAAVAIKPLSGLLRKEAGGLALETANAAKLASADVTGFARLAEGGITDVRAAETLGGLSEIKAAETLKDFEVVESQAAKGSEMLSGAEAEANGAKMLEAQVNTDAYYDKVFQELKNPLEL
ncbi:hypothetical protein [uncultured Gammaproteobacteria bacterium]|nr:hypothetical protein [uncultured Gammaproteobacteria bacterium]CAC9660638.1 hypothetical protein [uncultured Gammaproteobacteria bacterium]CAC9984622.1 hypothetical protein [uncultured Gammaproteobacteria bacterium]